MRRSTQRQHTSIHELASALSVLLRCAPAESNIDLSPTYGRQQPRLLSVSFYTRSLSGSLPSLGNSPVEQRDRGKLRRTPDAQCQYLSWNIKRAAECWSYHSSTGTATRSTPTYDEELFVPNADFLKQDFFHEGRLTEAQPLCILQKATTLLSREPNLVNVESCDKWVCVPGSKVGVWAKPFKVWGDIYGQHVHYQWFLSYARAEVLGCG